MKTGTEMVREFHEAFGLMNDLRLKVGKAYLPVLHLRMKLVSEEYLEVLEAFRTVVARLYRKASEGEIEDAKKDLLKELCDLRYTIDGFATTFGMNIEEAYERVHASNMSKLGADGKPIYREDGKVLKGPNYQPADLSGLV